MARRGPVGRPAMITNPRGLVVPRAGPCMYLKTNEEYSNEVAHTSFNDFTPIWTGTDTWLVGKTSGATGKWVRYSYQYQTGPALWYQYIVLTQWTGSWSNSEEIQSRIPPAAAASLSPQIFLDDDASLSYPNADCNSGEQLPPPDGPTKPVPPGWLDDHDCLYNIPFRGRLLHRPPTTICDGSANLPAGYASFIYGGGSRTYKTSYQMFNDPANPWPLWKATTPTLVANYETVDPGDAKSLGDVKNLTATVSNRLSLRANVQAYATHSTKGKVVAFNLLRTLQESIMPLTVMPGMEIESDAGPSIFLANPLGLLKNVGIVDPTDVESWPIT